MLFLDNRLDLFLDDDAHGFIEDVLEAILSEGTAFHILALELFFDDLSSCFFHDWGLFWVFLVDCIFFP